MDKRINKAIAGDVDALSALLLEHYDRLRVLLAAKISSRYQAVVSPEDVLQETFADVFQAIHSLKADTDQNFVTWLNAIAMNRLRDAIDRERAKKRGGDKRRVSNETENSSGSIVNLLNQIDSETTTPSMQVSRSERIAKLHVYLEKLPPQYRDVLTLRYLENLGRQEIAERLGKTDNQIRGLLERALNLLRDDMGGSSL